MPTDAHLYRLHYHNCLAQPGGAIEAFPPTDYVRRLNALAPAHIRAIVDATAQCYNGLGYFDMPRCRCPQPAPLRAVQRRLPRDPRYLHRLCLRCPNFRADDSCDMSIWLQPFAPVTLPTPHCNCGLPATTISNPRAQPALGTNDRLR